MCPPPIIELATGLNVYANWGAILPSGARTDTIVETQWNSLDVNLASGADTMLETMHRRWRQKPRNGV